MQHYCARKGTISAHSDNALFVILRRHDQRINQPADKQRHATVGINIHVLVVHVIDRHPRISADTKTARNISVASEHFYKAPGLS